MSARPADNVDCTSASHARTHARAHSIRLVVIRRQIVTAIRRAFRVSKHLRDCSLRLKTLSSEMFKQMVKLHGLIVLMVMLFVSANPDDSLNRARRQTSAMFTIGAVLDSLDHGTEQAMLSGLQTVKMIYSKDDSRGQPLIKPAVIWIPKEKFLTATNDACELLRVGVVAFVSPPDPLIRQSVRMVSKQFHIPIIETHWDTDRSNSRFAINIHPSHDAFGDAVFEYLSSYSKWNHVILVLADYGNIVKHTAWLNNFEGTLVIRTLGADRFKWKAIVAELASSDARNFLLDIPYWYAKDFLVLAYVHNMTGEQYNYVFTDWDTHLLDLSAFKIDDGASISTFSITPNVGVHEPYGRGPFVENLRSTINKIERAQRYSDILPFLTASASLLYDSILLFGLTLLTLKDPITSRPGALTCDSEGAVFWPHGERLVREVKAFNSSKIPTVTGQILFDRHGYRSNFNMTILSLQNSGLQEIGYWTHRDRLQITHPIKKKKKIPKKPLTTVTLRVTTVPDTPFVIPKKFDAYGQPLKTPDAWEGYCVDLLNLISQDVGFNYTIDITMDHYGSRHVNESGEVYYNGIVGVVHRGEADMAVAALTITYEREQVLDFSTPFMTLGGSLLFMRPKTQKPSIFSFLQPLSPTVWAYVITTYIVVSVGLFLVARLSPYEWQNPHPCEAFSEEKENQFTVLSSFWFFITPLLNQGTEMAPHTISTRLLTGIWWFFALILISTYTANLAAFLTVDTTELPIESVEDLVAQTKIKYGTLQSGSSHDFFKYSRIPVFQRMWEFMSKNDVFVQNTEEGIERVLKGDYVFVLESSWNEFYNKRDCRLMQIGRQLDSKGYGIGLQQGSPYRDPISESILKLQKAQTLDQLKRKWWTEFNISEPCANAKEGSKEAKPLGIEQVGGVFVLLIIGFFWAFIVSVIEFCVHNKACVKSQGALFSEMWKELKFAMRCMTPSTRAKSSPPVIHEPTPVSITAAPEKPERSAEQETIEPVSVQSKGMLTVPMAESNEALLCPSANDMSSSGGSSVEDTYPLPVPPPPLPPQNTTGSPWSHLNNTQKKSPSMGEDWWTISQSAV
ncbi:Glutamate receptor ionotropic kainate 2 [Echinococcus multilocularis]|uniref:Glutamate receptor ionotropic kainate 2 n=1 Tax=Echinococcus multilocularis TaxID=6211 RepID=A0A068Y965_ECHMU|nr:Glutamate receptor ionotropic kainate 2 [Echinococcus multilocularis]